MVVPSKLAILPALLLFAAWLDAPAALATNFIRGDANLNGSVDISDGITTLEVIFLGKPQPGCDDAMDSNDDGEPDITDAIYTLTFLFVDSTQPPLPPYPGCGIDDTPDPTTCDSYPLCPPPDCYDHADLDRLAAGNIQEVICLPAPVAQTDILGNQVTVCPIGQSQCPDGTDGCAVQITKVTLTLDLPQQKATVHVEGGIKALAVDIKSVLGLTSHCLFDVDFKGDAVAAITTRPAPCGNLELAAVGTPTIDRNHTEVKIAASNPGLPGLCIALLGFQELFVNQLIDQFEPAIEESIAGVRDQLIGSVICGPGN